MMHKTVHLIRRFFGSLRPGGPPMKDLHWVSSQLTQNEFAIWSSMSGPDRRHSAAVAREVSNRLGVQATMPVVAAALLHDSGKTVSGLRTPGRVVATLCAGTVLRSRTSVEQWSRSRGMRRRIGLYLRHPEIGAERLGEAGSDALTIAWTREHHFPVSGCSVDPAIASVLREVDDD